MIVITALDSSFTLAAVRFWNEVELNGFRRVVFDNAVLSRLSFFLITGSRGVSSSSLSLSFIPLHSSECRPTLSTAQHTALNIKPRRAFRCGVSFHLILFIFSLFFFVPSGIFSN